MEEDESTTYFTIGIRSEDHPDVLELDTHFGVEVHSPAYAALADRNKLQTQNRRSLICECTAKIRLADNTFVMADIKIDNCNTRMLAGDKFLHSKKSCYEYGLPPVRMKTASKEPTSWKRDAGLIDYFDENDVLCTSLVYVDYDNPDLILMDMSTRLDAQIDEHYHATTSREVGVKPLRRKTKKPYHYLDFTPEGTDPWQNPELKKPRKPLALLAYERAKRILRSLRRTASGSTKSTLKGRWTNSVYLNTDESECSCQVRVVDAALAEAYHSVKDGNDVESAFANAYSRIQEGLSSLALGEEKAPT